MSQPQWPSVGMKCKCVSRQWHFYSGEREPVIGSIYTVRTIDFDEGEYWLRFVELVNAPQDYAQGFLECDWRASCFRPLVTRTVEQDISEHFKPLLDAEPPLVRIPHRGTVRA